MKSTLIILSAFLSLSAVAQTKNISINHNIDDNGKTLSISINGTINGAPVDYDRTFDVAGMTKEQRDEIKRHVYDSLGLANPTAPLAPLRPHRPLNLRAPIAPVEPNSAAPTIGSKSQYAESYTVGGDHLYTKEIKYNPSTGILFMKYRFMKDGEEKTAEKSVDAKGKSGEERKQIITNYEREIGILPPEII